MPAEQADARARQTLQHQIDLVAKNDDAGMTATFADGASVFTQRFESAKDAGDFGLGEGGADGVQGSNPRITKLVAHGANGAVWFYAEVTVTYEIPEDGKVTKNDVVTRVVELLSEADQWRAVAASFTRPDSEVQAASDNSEIAGATEAGPLAKVLENPASATLSSDAIVVGPLAGQLKVGADAQSAIASWTLLPIQLYQRPREIKSSAFSFAQAHMDAPRGRSTLRLGAQVFAIPDGPNSKVVLLQYMGKQ